MGFTLWVVTLYALLVLGAMIYVVVNIVRGNKSLLYPDDIRH